MKRDDNSLGSTLDRYMRQAGEPPAGQVASSVEAVWERLRPEAECSTPPAREMVSRRSHFTVAAAVIIVTVAFGLYAAQRTRLLQAMFPVQQPAQQQSPLVSVNPLRERVTIGGVAESKEPVTTSNPRQPVGAAVAEATLPQRTGASAGPLLRIDGKPSQGTTIPATPLAFEVASIRPIPRTFPMGNGGWIVTNGQFVADPCFVQDVIGFAYNVPGIQVKGVPAWLGQEPYSFEARARSAAAGPDQIRLMLQTLFRERFKLVVHRETEEESVYRLVVGKNGSKLREAKGGQQPYINWTGPGQVTFTEIPNLSGLISILSISLGSPVLDETGLSGPYDFNLGFTDPRDPRPRQADSPPDLITAVQDQLGLELHATRRAVEIVVIDHIERPSAN